MFETLLMQVTDQLTTIYGTTAGIIIAVCSLIHTFYTRKETKGKLSAQDTAIDNAAQAGQLGAQKATDNIGLFTILADTIQNLAATPEQKKYLNDKLGPHLQDVITMLSYGNAQIEKIKEITGTDVDKNASIPRENVSVTAKLNPERVDRLGV